VLVVLAQMKILSFILIIFLLIQPAISFADSEKHSCAGSFREISETPASKTAIAIASKLSHEIKEQAEKEFGKNPKFSAKAKGYAVLFATMVGNAALTAYASSIVPKNYEIAVIIFGQFSYIFGFSVFGSAILEPITSDLRAKGFQLVNGRTSDLLNVKIQEFLTLWQRTQRYPMNAQMSRNLINNFIASIKINLSEAYRAGQSENPEYAADQIAEAAVRLRNLFEDILPTDINVARAVQASFTNHLEVDQKFIEKVWRKIQALDHNSNTFEIQKYYKLLLNTWLLAISNVN
jgi:hypothetical protein